MKLYYAKYYRKNKKFASALILAETKEDAKERFENQYKFYLDYDKENGTKGTRIEINEENDLTNAGIVWTM